MRQLLEKFNFDKLFCAMLLIFGILLVFITPTNQAPDELAHLFRAYQVSDGVFCGPYKEYARNENEKVLFIYSKIPKSLWKLDMPNIGAQKNYYSVNSTYEFLHLPLNAEDFTESAISNTGSYSPLVYAPQALFIFLARETFNTVGAVFYSARLGTVFFTAICIFFAIKLLPEKKALILILAFSPMFLFEIGSCSADAVIYSISFLSAAFLFSLRKSTEQISKRELFFLVLTAIALGLSKQVYGTILFLFFLIPAERFGGKKNFYLHSAGIFAVYLVTALGWIMLAKSGANISPALSAEADMTAQLNFMMSSPGKFLFVCAATIFNYAISWAREFIGVLGWLAIFLPNWFYIFYAAAIFAASLFGNIDLKISQRFIILFSVIPTTLFLLFFNYITWSPVQNDTVLGIQGRYFIPLSLTFFTAFSFFKNNRYENFFILFVCLFSSSVTFYKIIEHFY